MATHHGKQGVVMIGANTIAEVTAFTYTQTAEVADDSACGDTYRTKKVGLFDASGSITCHYDPSDANGQDIMSIGAEVTLLLYFEDGSSSGETEWSVIAIITEVTKTLERDSITEHSFNFEGNGAPTEGAA